MSPEPPVVSPASLAEALRAHGRGRLPPHRRRHRPHGPAGGATSPSRRPRSSTCGGSGELRGIGYDGYEVSIGALTTFTRAAPLPGDPGTAAGAGRGGGHDRSGPDPEPRHDRRQHLQRLSGRRLAAGPPGRGCPPSTSGRRHGERTVPAREFWTAYRQTALRPDELLLRVRFPVERHRHTRFRKVGTRRAQAISKVVMALSYQEDGGVWRDVRLALGSVAPTTDPGAPDRGASSRARRRRESVADHAAAVLAGELRAHRRRALHGRLPPLGQRARAASPPARGGWLVSPPVALLRATALPVAPRSLRTCAVA